MGWVMRLPGMAHLLRWVQYWMTEDRIELFTDPDSPAARRLRIKMVTAGTSLKQEEEEEQRASGGGLL
jgi:hypothetical protein